MTQYARGRAKEYQCRNQLREEGYFVLRSAGSHTKIDLFAIYIGKPGEEKPLFRAIQCKLGSSPQGQDIAELRELKEVMPTYIRFELWHFQNHKPPTVTFL